MQPRQGLPVNLNRSQPTRLLPAVAASLGMPSVVPSAVVTLSSPVHPLKPIPQLQRPQSIAASGSQSMQPSQVVSSPPLRREPPTSTHFVTVTISMPTSSTCFCHLYQPHHSPLTPPVRFRLRGVDCIIALVQACGLSALRRRFIRTQHHQEPASQPASQPASMSWGSGGLDVWVICTH